MRPRARSAPGARRCGVAADTMPGVCRAAVASSREPAPPRHGVPQTGLLDRLPVRTMRMLGADAWRKSLQAPRSTAARMEDAPRRTRVTLRGECG